MKYCSKCGVKLDSEVKFCGSCGASIASSDTSSPVKNTVNINNVNNKPNTNGLSIAGFVISLISLLCCCGFLSGLSLIFSIIGLVQINKNNEGGRGLAIAGIIISSLGVLIILLFSILGYFTDFINSLYSLGG